MYSQRICLCSMYSGCVLAACTCDTVLAVSFSPVLSLRSCPTVLIFQAWNVQADGPCTWFLRTAGIAVRWQRAVSNTAVITRSRTRPLGWCVRGERAPVNLIAWAVSSSASLASDLNAGILNNSFASLWEAAARHGRANGLLRIPALTMQALRGAGNDARIR